jgi:hypothetical protein
MVGSGRNNPDFDSVLRVPVQELIVHEDLKILKSKPSEFTIQSQINQQGKCNELHEGMPVAAKHYYKMSLLATTYSIADNIKIRC